MRHRLSHISVDNVLTWDQAVLISSLTNGYDIIFARWIQDDIHEWAFREFIAIPLPYLV